jgi:hypothetical protein
VVTNNENAEYGRSSGATINVASASGTNRFHATLYEFIRNTDLNAAGYFKPTIGRQHRKHCSLPEADLQSQPVRRELRRPHPQGQALLLCRLRRLSADPQAAQRLDSAYAERTQRHPGGSGRKPDYRSRLPGAGTAIPASAINPISQQIIGFFKQIPGLPVSGLASTGLATNDYSKLVPFTDDSDKGDLRLDYQQNASSSWFVRVSDRKETGVNYPAILLPLDGQTNGTIRILDQQVALGYTHLWGANKVIDARVGLSKTKAGKYSLSIGDNAITIPGLPTNPTVAGGLPSTSISGFTRLAARAPTRSGRTRLCLIRR